MILSGGLAGEGHWPLTANRRFSASSQNVRRSQVACEPAGEEESESEVYNLVLTGGPKWGFRIKQLTDGRVIVSRIDRGPAERGGLRVYDELLSVNGVQLSNQPRSLLLYDHPEQELLLASEQHTPLPQTSVAASQPQPPPPTMQLEPKQTGAEFPAGVELSKLDFAYQLIKHSSASNKLLLSVRRFLSAAYARASALAATNTLGAWNFSSSHQYRKSVALNEPATHQLRAAGVRHDSLKRPHTATGNVYKCCDCYCDNQGEYGQISGEKMII